MSDNVYASWEMFFFQSKRRERERETATQATGC